jgi:hypothetical protein
VKLASLDTDRVLRDIDRATLPERIRRSREAAERVLRLAAPGLGDGADRLEIRRELGYRITRSAWLEHEIEYGCVDEDCECTLVTPERECIPGMLSDWDIGIVEGRARALGARDVERSIRLQHIRYSYLQVEMIAEERERVRRA